MRGREAAAATDGDAQDCWEIHRMIRLSWHGILEALHRKKAI